MERASGHHGSFVYDLWSMFPDLSSDRSTEGKDGWDKKEKYKGLQAYKEKVSSESLNQSRTTKLQTKPIMSPAWRSYPDSSDPISNHVKDSQLDGNTQCWNSSIRDRMVGMAYQLGHSWMGRQRKEEGLGKSYWGQVYRVGFVLSPFLFYGFSLPTDIKRKTRDSDSFHFFLSTGYQD